MSAPSDLNVRLGFEAGAKLLIINGDDYGMCRASTMGVSQLLGSGGLNSATVMMPCPWAPMAIAKTQAAWDVGVHLVLTSEWDNYRWRPLSNGATLKDDRGYFPADCLTVEKRASDEDVAIELRAQVEAAYAAGLDVTHLDNHMGSVYGLETGRQFLGQVFELCVEYRLPFRLPRSVIGMGLGDTLQEMLDFSGAIADSNGIVLPDYLWTHPFELVGEGTDEAETYDSVKAGFLALMADLRPGVTEFFIHPMTYDDELKDAANFAQEKRGWELRLMQDPEVLGCFDRLGVTRIGWRDLRDLQRGER